MSDLLGPGLNGGKRIVVFVASLGSGGAERVAVRVCGWLRDAGHSISLLTLSGADSDFYPCPDGVQRLGLCLQAPSKDILKAVSANVRRWLAVRRAVIDQRADVVLSLGDRTNVLMLLATLGVPCRKIISERTDPSRQSLSRGWKLLRRLTYPTASLHVSQSHYASDWVRKHFPSLAYRVIGNAGELDEAKGLAKVGGRDHFLFVAVGRLSREKGVDLLLTAMALAKNRSPVQLKLVVAGNGEERAALSAQVEELALSDSVKFLGRVADIQSVLLRADAFVLPSRWEGFPNVLIEAMTLGMPVIASRCRGGVEDVLYMGEGPCALEFPPGDTEALADRMVQMATDPVLRTQLGERARIRSGDYSAERISAAWCEVVAY